MIYIAKVWRQFKSWILPSVDMGRECKPQSQIAVERTTKEKKGCREGTREIKVWKTEWASGLLYFPYKELVSRIYKGLLQITNKKIVSCIQFKNRHNNWCKNTIAISLGWASDWKGMRGAPCVLELFYFLTWVSETWPRSFWEKSLWFMQYCMFVKLQWKVENKAKPKTIPSNTHLLLCTRKF